MDFQVRVRSCVSAGRATLAVFHRYADGVYVVRGKCHAVGLAAPCPWHEDTSRRPCWKRHRRICACWLAASSTWELTFEHPDHLVQMSVVYLQSYGMYNADTIYVNRPSMLMALIAL